MPINITYAKLCGLKGAPLLSENGFGTSDEDTITAFMPNKIL